MSQDEKTSPQEPATLRFLLHSGEILDHEGKPTGVTMQDLLTAAAARFDAHLAIDPELKNVPSEPRGSGHAALMEIARLLARRAVREQLAKAQVQRGAATPAV